MDFMTKIKPLKYSQYNLIYRLVKLLNKTSEIFKNSY